MSARAVPARVALFGLLVAAVALLPSASALGPADVPALAADAPTVALGASSATDNGVGLADVPILPVTDLPVPVADPVLVSAALHADTAIDSDAGLHVDGGGSISAADPDARTADAMPADRVKAFPSIPHDLAAPVAAATFTTLVLAALAFASEAVRGVLGRATSSLGTLGKSLVARVALSPLFSRIDRSQVLDNEIRARVHQTVVEDPGVSASDIHNRNGIARGTAVHHLRRLESHGLVVSVTQLAHRRYFAADSPAARQRHAVALILHPTARRIAQLVTLRPGIDQTLLCDALAINNPAASKHLSNFASGGLVVVQRQGRHRSYRATPSLEAALLAIPPMEPMARPAPTALFTNPLPTAPTRRTEATAVQAPLPRSASPVVTGVC